MYHTSIQLTPVTLWTTVKNDFRASHGPTLVGRPGVGLSDFISGAAARPGPSFFQSVGLAPAQPVTFTKHVDPARLITYSKVWALPGPSHGSEEYETRALYGLARQLREPAREFDGPAHGPAHLLCRTKRYMCIG